MTITPNRYNLRNTCLLNFKLGLSILFSTIILIGTYGQSNIQFKYLTKSDGLSQVSVFSIAQDQEGFLWFGTRDGLNKYDGYQFKVYKQDKIASNDVRVLYYDKTGHKLIVGTVGGLSIYDEVKDTFLNLMYDLKDTTTLSSNVIRSILRDSKGRLWVGTANGLNLYDDTNHTFRRIKDIVSVKGRANNLACDVVFEDSNKDLWLGTNEGLYKIDGASDDIVIQKADINRQLSSLDISTIEEDTKENLWIGTKENGINYWDRTSDIIIKYDVTSNLTNNNIRSTSFDKEGNLWIGTFNGLNKYNSSTAKFTPFKKSSQTSSGLSDNSIRSIFCDKKGSIWIGTYYGGITHLDDDYNQFINVNPSPTSNGLSANVVSSFMEEEDGSLWIGTEGEGLSYLNANTDIFEEFIPKNSSKPALAGKNIKKLYKDGDKLWIGYFSAGLDVYDTKSRSIRHYKNDPNNPKSLANDNVYSIHKEGDKMWLATYGSGISILDLKTDEFHSYNASSEDNTVSSNLIRVFLKMKDQSFWVGTENGLNKIKVGRDGLPTSFEVKLPNEKIYSLQEDSYGNMWIGTISNGLYKYNLRTDTFQQYTDKEGLPGNTIFGILEDDAGNIWISTNNGLSKYSPKDDDFTNYNTSNGLSNVEFFFNAYYKTKSGDLLFGGINGYIRFDPSKITTNNYIPPVVLTELSQNNTEVDISKDGVLPRSINHTKNLVFNYNEANFTIKYAALDYFSPELNHYAVKMEGLDREWNYSVGKTEATYTIQREGDYTFRLRGGNSEGLWNPEELNLKVKVLPPPWRAWWAYLIYLVGLCLGGLSIYRYFSLENKLKLQRIAKEQQEELHEVKLRFFTNITHEFRTPLTLILGPIKDLINRPDQSSDNLKQLNMIDRSAQRLLNLVNQILTFRKLANDHEPIAPQEGNIVDLLQEVYLPFSEAATKKNIFYTFKAEKEVINAWYDVEKLEKVFFNLLSNAFKFTPENGSISVKIKEKNNDIVIEFKDSGIGVDQEFHEQIFKRFYEKAIPQDSTIKGSGIGLAISKQMVELHMGTIRVKSKKDNGAKFVITLHKGKEHFTEEQLNNVPTRSSDKTLDYILPEYKSLFPIDNLEDTQNANEIPLVIIVEDNTEVNDYIQFILKPHYRILTAYNGIKGLEKIKKHNPDLIISDVMMPQMDGIELCRLVKTDFDISHIPIILLTARTAALFKIEGLKTGADDYVTKPFDPEELKLRVANLISLRKKVKEKFARVLTFDPREIHVTSSDEEFLDNALKTAEANIENYEFTVDQFAEKLNVSRALLFTKLKSLTGQTPNNFIKTIRLKRSAQLILMDKLNISEIAYMVGFKDPKYFSKCFVQQFDVKPSEYKESIPTKEESV